MMCLVKCYDVVPPLAVNILYLTFLEDLTKVTELYIV